MVEEKAQYLTDPYLTFQGGYELLFHTSEDQIKKNYLQNAIDERK